MTDINFTERKSKELRERSNSTKNVANRREVKNSEYVGSSNKYNDCHGYMAKATKEYNQNEYQLSSHKKAHQNNDYIKSLYKKYLGKQNQNQSDKKNKNDAKIQKALFRTDEVKEPIKTQAKADVDCTPLVIKHSITQQSCCKDGPNILSEDISEPGSSQIPTKYISAISISTSKQIKVPKQRQRQIHNFYKQWMNESSLQFMGNPRSSLVRCMKNICRAKKIIGLR